MHGHGHIVRAKAAATDTLAAVDRVVDKLEHRMEKLKGKLIGRSHPRRHGSVDFAVGNGAPAVDLDETDGEPGRGRIVKTKQFDIKPMTPEEAALQMELHLPLFRFGDDNGVLRQRHSRTALSTRLRQKYAVPLRAAGRDIVDVEDQAREALIENARL